MLLNVAVEDRYFRGLEWRRHGRVLACYCRSRDLNAISSKRSENRTRTTAGNALFKLVFEAGFDVAGDEVDGLVERLARVDPEVEMPPSSGTKVTQACAASSHSMRTESRSVVT